MRIEVELVVLPLDYLVCADGSLLQVDEVNALLELHRLFVSLPQRGCLRSVAVVIQVDMSQVLIQFVLLTLVFFLVLLDFLVFVLLFPSVPFILAVSESRLLLDRDRVFDVLIAGVDKVLVRTLL